ncbi:MAG: histidinol-phosphate aminotransferase [Bacteroidia bacterium]|nr:MAG: histidinol-phosphate aminotransferase [Bacteroidia bacterium]
MDIQSYIKDNVKNLIPYSSARSEFKGNEGIFLDANENPYGIYNRYPDPYQKNIKKKIAELKQIPENHIFLGNGSDEVLDVLMRIFLEPKQDSLLIFPPTYGMYEVLANINQVKIYKISLNLDFQLPIQEINNFLKNEQPKMAILCSPNNPTGNSLENISEFLDIFRGIVVIDEAYIDFSKQPSFLSYLSQYPNVIISQTFSKAWGLAGVRVGMAFANPLIINYMNAVKYPYNISLPNQQILEKSLNNPKKVQKEIQRILENRDFLISELAKIPWVKNIYPTDANFVLIEVEDANFIYQKLLEYPIVVRNRHSQIPNTLRITIGKKSELKKLIKEIKNINKSL